MFSRNRVEVFPLQRRDVREVQALDRMEYGPANSLCVAQLCKFLALPRTAGFVAMHNERILGYALYRIRHQSIHLASLVVHPGFRRQHIGTQLIHEVLELLKRKYLPFLWVKVRETNLPGQLFLKSQTFLWVCTLRGEYDAAAPEDAYMMEWRKRPEYSRTNRITQYLKGSKSNSAPDPFYEE